MFIYPALIRLGGSRDSVHKAGDVDGACRAAKRPNDKRVIDVLPRKDRYWLAVGWDAHRLNGVVSWVSNTAILNRQRYRCACDIRRPQIHLIKSRRTSDCGVNQRSSRSRSCNRDGLAVRAARKQCP